ncbi:MAG: hypothetical protein KF684_11400 [Phycisphaeraceae bacterium]|nr:hypothetical protein [Phycisphaeraceae bacterium]
MRRRAVTIPELLVAIAVVVILVAITIPVLRTGSIRGHDARNQSRLRSTHQHFQLYANDHADAFVNAGPPAIPGYPIVIDFGAGNGGVALDYLMQAWWWPYVVAAHFGEAFPTWHSTHPPPYPQHQSPSRPVGGVTNNQYAADSDFVYSRAMLVDPTCFTSEERIRDPRCHRLVRWSEVAFASSKGLMADTARPSFESGSRHRNVSFVDGSVALMNMATRAPAPAEIGWEGIPVYATPLGVLGRDFVR